MEQIEQKLLLQSQEMLFCYYCNHKKCYTLAIAITRNAILCWRLISLFIFDTCQFQRSMHISTEIISETVTDERHVAIADRGSKMSAFD